MRMPRRIRHQCPCWVWAYTVEDLGKIVAAVERLSPANVAQFRANENMYSGQLGYYSHAPGGVEVLWQNLTHELRALAQRLEASSADTYAILPPLPSEKPTGPEVALA
jgi:hypothetical protein